MTPQFLIPAGYHQAELEIKRSRFLTIIQPIKDVQEAKQQLQTIRQQHPHANHHCWARLAGKVDNAHLWDCSDDGEPKGTAGKPMLQVLTHSGIGHIHAVVVRYFGGIKLGTGGLVRGYSQAVNLALSELQTEIIIETQPVRLIAPHNLTGEVEQIFRQLKLPVGNRQWLDSFSIECELTEDQLVQLQGAIERYSGIIFLQLTINTHT